MLSTREMALVVEFLNELAGTKCRSLETQAAALIAMSAESGLNVGRISIASWGRGECSDPSELLVAPDLSCWGLHILVPDGTRTLEKLLADYRPDWGQDVPNFSRTLWRPFSRGTRDALQQICSDPEKKRYVFEAQYHQLASAIGQVIEQMRKRISSRITLPRIRDFLPARLIETATAYTEAQALVGRDMGYSRAPLFYFSRRTSALVELITESLTPVFGAFETEWSSGGAAEWISVSGVGLLPNSAVASMVAALKARTVEHQTTRRPSEPTEQLRWRLRELGNLSLYSAWLHCMSLTHRLNAHSATITADDIDGCLATTRDKVIDAVHLSRVGAYPEIAQQQSEAYLSLLAACLEWLRSTQGLIEGIRTQAEKMIVAALSGTGPLFLSFTDDRLLPVDHVLLKSVLPAGCPANALRHWMSRRLRELGAISLDVNLQMGQYPLEQPFGDSSIDTPARLAGRLAPAINQVLTEVGWTVLRPKSNHQLNWRRYRPVEMSAGPVRLNSRADFISGFSAGF